jgi:hypothetical protein
MEHCGAACHDDHGGDQPVRAFPNRSSRLAANHSYRITAGRVLAADGETPLDRPFVVTFRTGYR